MPRKGRLVQPRHIFPWIAAPYIEMLRILLRIERFFFLPIRYLQAWTVSAIFGVMGVLFSVALFIPRLVATSAQASTGVQRELIRLRDMPYIPEEDLVLPESRGPRLIDVSVRMQRTHVEDFDQNERATTFSKPWIPQRSLHAQRDAWTRHLFRQAEPEDRSFQAYIQRARVRSIPLAPVIPEYQYDPGVGDFRTNSEKAPTLLIRKSVPRILSPDEPLTYIITVTNNGDEPVESTTVEEFVSDIQRVVDCDPPAQVSPDYGHLIWDLTQVQPGETRRLSVTIQPDKRRPIIQDTLVTFSSAPIIAETMVRQTQPELPVIPVVPEPEPIIPTVVPEAVKRPAFVGRPKLVIQFEPPKAVKVGEELEAYYTVTNVGTADATGIRLLVEVPAQLRHRFGELVEHKISRLTPNESRRALFAALAETSGQLPLNWTLEANELDTLNDAEWVAVLPGPKVAPERPSPTIINSPTPISSIPRSSSPQGSVPNSSIPNSSIPNSSIPNSSIPASSIPASSIPASEPTLIDDAIQPTLLSNPRIGGRSIPPSNSTIPVTPNGPRPLQEPSSIPSWADPVLGGDPDLGVDPEMSRPIEPELMPDEPPVRGHGYGIQPPDDLLPLETEPPLTMPSTIPLEGLPTEGTDGVKEQ